MSQTSMAAEQQQLKQRVILVTGAGDGIGAVAAQTYAQHGATVVLLGRTIAKLEKTYDAIKNNGDPEPAIYPLNLEGATEQDYLDMANTIGNELGRLDGVLHNAAVLGELTPLEHYRAELWQKVMHINVTAAWQLSRACLPLLRQASDPKIVFTLHRTTSAYWGAYGIAKAAVESLMRILADELDTDPPIAVNAIIPGETQSPMVVRAFPGKDIKQLPSMQSLMPSYLYLMGPQSSGLTGRIMDGRGE